MNRIVTYQSQRVLYTYHNPHKPLFDEAASVYDYHIVYRWHRWEATMWPIGRMLEDVLS